MTANGTSVERAKSLVKEAKGDVDVLALQEGLAFQLEELAEVLRDYRKVGQHREGGLAGEFSGLYVRNELEVLNTGEFWFSETPEVPGSRSWDSSLPRMCAWADVAVAPGAPAMRLYGTHYDHRGAVARKRSTELILEHSRGAERVVVMGDLNARESDAPVAALSSLTQAMASSESKPSVCRGVAAVNDDTVVCLATMRATAAKASTTTVEGSSFVEDTPRNRPKTGSLAAASATAFGSKRATQIFL